MDAFLITRWNKEGSSFPEFHSHEIFFATSSVLFSIACVVRRDMNGNETKDLCQELQILCTLNNLVDACCLVYSLKSG